MSAAALDKFGFIAFVVMTSITFVCIGVGFIAVYHQATGGCTL
jgi:hypothetical protein